MRQIHIKRHASLPQDNLGSSVVINVTSLNLANLAVPPVGLTYCNVPFVLKRLDEFDNDFHVSFQLTKDAAARGIVLIGAYLEDQGIRAILGSMMGEPIHLIEDFPLLVMSFSEQVHLRAIDPYQGSAQKSALKPAPKRIKRKR